MERSCADLLGQSRPLCLGDCWTCSTAGEPPFESGDRPRIDDRAALAGIVYQLRTGVPWWLLPTRELAAAAR